MSPSRRIIRNKRRSEAGDLLNKRSRCRSNKEYFVYLLVARLPFRLFQRFQRSRFRIPLRHTSCSFVECSSCILSEISLELFVPILCLRVNCSVFSTVCVENSFFPDSTRLFLCGVKAFSRLLARAPQNKLQVVVFSLTCN